MNIEDRPPIHLFIKEISKTGYEAAKNFYNEGAAYKSDQVIVVHELAFGCVGEQTARVSLWYDIAEMIELTPQEVKRVKRNRQRNNSSNAEAPNNITCYPGCDQTTSSAWTDRSSMRVRTATSFDTHPHKPFFRVEPVTKVEEAVKLVIDVLYHRISVLIQREYRAYSKNDSVVRDIIISQDSVLEKTFDRIKKDTENWQWPVSKGREIVTSETKVPKTLTKYMPSSTSQVTPIWDNFLCHLELGSNESKNKCSEPSESNLPIFKKIANSEVVNPSKIVPLISSGSNNEERNEFIESFFHDWKQISAHYHEDSNSIPAHG